MMSQAQQLEAARHGRGPVGYITLARHLVDQGVERGYPRVSDSGYVQAHYNACRMDGVPHKLAEMFALGQPPMSNTDREFLEGQGGCYDQFGGNEFLGNFYAAQAKKAGVSTTGKVYLSGLARYPGDPEAWVSGRGDAQRVLEQRGWGAHGALNVKVRDCEPAGKGGLASDVVDSLVAERLAEVPAGERADREALRESVVSRHAPHWAPTEIGA